MRKAFVCASLSMRLILRSGRLVFPVLALIGYPLLFYHVIPVDTMSSFTMSTVMAFFWGAWVAIASVWSEDKTLRQILLVKAGQTRYFLAQDAGFLLFGAVGGIFLVLAPVCAQRIFLPDMFVQAPSLSEILLGLVLNACAGLCGGAFGAVFHPRCIRDRKAAYLFCLLAGLLGLVAGSAGIPFALRVLLPPLYDTIDGIFRADAWTAIHVLPCALWYLAYALVCVFLQSVLLRRTEE